MATEYKLKGLTSIDLKNGQKQEVEVDGIEGGKILLAKVKDQVHAMSANCTHYGAPLVKGVLTGEGRITCPWHGACFKVSTGDVEDAPALDPLAKFEVFERDGAVYIKGEEKTIKANRRQLNIKCRSVKDKDHVVVIGSGSGALGAIEGLRGGGYQGKITVVSRENAQPLDRTKLSKALITDQSKIEWRSMEFYKEASVEFTWGNVTKVDFNNRSVETDDGKKVNYTKLIMASGGTPKWLPMDGLKGDLENVFVLRALPHAQGIMKAAGEDGGKKVVVVGSSFIGMEVGNCLASMKHDVTIVGMEEEPMMTVMGKELGKTFRGLLEKNGVKFKLSAEVEGAKPSESDSKKVGSVQLKDGTNLPADLVIEGVGVRPSTDYLQDVKEIKLNKDGSVNVNESFQVEGLKDVFAIGDIATYPYHGPGGNGKPVRIEHWDVAQNAGRSVAGTINDPSAPPKSFIPVFWSALGAQLRYCGNTPNGYDDVIIQGETDAQKGPSFVAYYHKGEEIVAVASMMKDPYMTQSAELMRRKKMPSKSEILKGVDILGVGIPSEIKI
ncbi:rubredoxin-NAD(+) reductase [Aureobasidium namibiae CBS 147.97]|uniref:Rubredoxin-NAD(+) reductase n=1 Tax=Aureobasidium namibiae CBS 147.97 TaxID=1043004 RepID=A0A074WX27_9PEZI|nr:rubredoxin-NAD(+) reductase [Aureobasidium namibiae CBS 147.97]KEQ77780.1 rubredoxin-NAD(+) reductase [Aureobasidium namibiae CBS 147.97]